MFNAIALMVDKTIKLFKSGETYKGIAYGGATAVLLIFPQYSEYIVGVAGTLLTAVKAHAAIADTIDIPSPTGGDELDGANIEMMLERHE